MERETIKCDDITIDSNAPAVLAKHLKKIYRLSGSATTVAVADVSFFTKIGDCFALLGTNGAGKTTTFKMLTRDINPTDGEIFIDGKELGSNFPKIRKRIGYAPQYESCYMAMTVRENLEFYARIKGISIDKREPLIVKMIQEMRLGEYEYIQAGDLSGGNKRKLTVALAILGNPSIVFLDEPSTGVDPQAKRFMWKVIQRISTANKNTSVILTTHSMEEAEALCTKMAIMVGGSFCCIGTPQELKEKFGKGFEIQINIPLPSEKEEIQLLNDLNSQTNFNYQADSLLTRENILSLFNSAKREDLAIQLSKEGVGSSMQAELDAGRMIKAKIVASFLLIEQQGRKFAFDLASEYCEVKIAEHLSNYFKFRVDKKKPTHTIGHLFGLMQDLTEKYNIIQYSVSQTSLTQIFQTFAKQAEVLFLIKLIVFSMD